MSDLQINAVLQYGKSLSGKWKMEILYRLVSGPARWSDLTHSFPTAAPNVLTRQLRQLEQEGFIVRFVLSPKPPKVVEYTLSATGHRLIPILESLQAWDQEFHSKEAV